MTDAHRVSQGASILFPPSDGAVQVLGESQPDCFRDLNLDQVVDQIVAGRDDYELKPFFHAPLPRDPGVVVYRHEVVRDLERDDVRSAVDAFAERMRLVRRCLELEDELRYRYEKERLFLDAADAYCEAVAGIERDLRAAAPRSRGLAALGDRLRHYVRGDPFISLAADAQSAREALASVTYSVRIQGSRVTVDEYGGESDLSADVEETFARFKQGAAKDYRMKVRDSVGLDHVEAQVLELVARLRPEPFAALDRFHARHAGFLDEAIAAFDREVQFYLAYLDHIARFRAAGLPLCLPEVGDHPSAVAVEGAFDIALATKLVRGGSEVVRNDIALRDPERIAVVTGPNQGGKTTFARMFGQVHYLAALGLPVPARRARLGLADRVLTHFEREEEVATLHGKLEEDLVRLRDLLEQAGPRTVLILNESLTSTTLEDARFLGTELLERITDLGSLAVYVTFVDELSELNAATVSLVAGVDPADPAERTYRIARRPADGLAHAWALAEQHGLTYGTLIERVAR
jgi:DNA mismatch repair protein MutS